MPEKKTNADTSDQASTGAAGKKGLPIKAVLIVLALLLVEAAVVIGVVSVGRPPDAVKGGEIELAPVDALNEIGEILIAHDKFPNHQTGRVWLWDVEVQAQVKQMHLAYVEKVLQERGAEIKTGISQIVRTAHQKHLEEPNLETLTRQFAQYLREVFGEDPNGEARIQRVLLPQCVGFPADF